MTLEDYRKYQAGHLEFSPGLETEKDRIKSEKNEEDGILVNLLLARFRDRAKPLGRRAFVAVVRQGDICVVRARNLRCYDNVIFIISLTPEENVDETLVRVSLHQYIHYKSRLPH